MKDKLFELKDVLKALDLEYEDQFFWADRCEITDKGFFPIPLTARDRELLSGGPELEEIYKLLENLELALPCTRGQLIEWAERCGFDDALPDEFFNSQNNEQSESDGNDDNHRPLLAYLKPIHQKEGLPTGLAFLRKLKHYVNPEKNDSGGPIIRVVTSASPNGRGFQYSLSKKITPGEKIPFYTLENLGKRCSEWRKEAKSDACKNMSSDKSD
jgi:hypothetical protein